MATSDHLASLFLQGKSIVLENKFPLRLDDPRKVYLVSCGQVELFGQQTESEKNPRQSLLSVEAGAIFSGFSDRETAEGNVGVFATGVLGTTVVELNWNELLQSAVQENAGSEEMVFLLDQWLESAGIELADSAGNQKIDVKLTSAESVNIKSGQLFGATEKVFWASIAGETGFLLGQEIVGGEDGFFPLCGGLWMTGEFDGSIEIRESAEMLQNGNRLVEDLIRFHEMLIDILWISRTAASIEDVQQQGIKAGVGVEVDKDAIESLIEVVDPKGDRRQPGAALPSEDPLLSAFTVVGNKLGVKVNRHPDLENAKDVETRLSLIAKASHVRLRRVLLEGPWWEQEQGSMIGFRGDDGRAVALIYDGSEYELHDPAVGSIEFVNKETAASLAPFATAVYRTFVGENVGVKDFLKFSLFGLRSEFVVILIMSVAVGLLGMLTPVFTTKIIDQVIPSADREMMWQYTGALLSAALGAGAFHLVRGMGILRMEGKIDFSAQSAIWSRLMELPSGFFRDYAAGDLAERAYAIDAIRSIISNGAVTTLLGVFTGLFQGIVMFTIDVKLAAIGLGLIFLMVVVITAANYAQLTFQRKEYRIRGDIAGLALQLLTGVSKIRVAAAESHAFRNWAKKFSKQKRIGFVIGRIQNFVEVFNAGFPIICSIVLFGFFAYTLQKAVGSGGEGGISTGQFIAFNTAFTMVMTAMTSLGMISLQLLEIVPIFERVRPILEEKPEVSDDRRHPGSLTGEIELFHLNFRYTEDGPLIIRNVDLKIRRGEFVAFVGPSGSGKSTLLRLLLGFEVPESGYLYYDGQDLSTLDLREVRKQMGVVLQTSQLLPTTIYQNIVGASTTLNPADAMFAAKASGLDQDIEQMPMGMYTVVSEGGAGFSGGQKQRLMIARALVNKPRMVFFDEATSALDNQTQRIVTESLDRMDATRIVVAHRLSTVVDADRIVVLDAGEVVEQGSYEELIALNGVFYELAKEQQT